MSPSSRKIHALLKRCTSKGYRGFESLPHRFWDISASATDTYASSLNGIGWVRGNSVPKTLVTCPLFSTEVAGAFRPACFALLTVAAPVPLQAGQVIITHGGTYTFTVGQRHYDVSSLDCSPEPRLDCFTFSLEAAVIWDFDSGAVCFQESAQPLKCRPCSSPAFSVRF